MATIDRMRKIQDRTMTVDTVLRAEPDELNVGDFVRWDAIGLPEMARSMCPTQILR